MSIFERVSIKTKLFSAFIIMAMLTLGVGAFGLYSASSFISRLDTLWARDVNGIFHVEGISIAMAKIGRSVRQMLLETDDRTKRDIQRSINQQITILQHEVEAAVPTLTAEEQTTLGAIRDDLDPYIETVRHITELSIADDNKAALTELRGFAPLAGRMVSSFESLLAHKKRIGADTKHDVDAAYAQVRGVLIAIVLTAVILGAGFGLIFAMSFGRAIEKTAQVSSAVSSAAEQLASASEHMSSGAQEQAASIEQTAASLEELSSAVRQNTEHAAQAAELAKSSRDTAERGGQVVRNAIEAMGEVSQASKKIADIISTIDEIAFQTNLLALNAAVEAARAGEQGRGFAVVAAEVRNLARRSAEAAKEIKTLIHDSVEKIGGSYTLVEKSGAVLTEIVVSARKLSDFVAEIAAASKEQSIGIDQVNQAITQVDRVTQTNAAQTEELASTADMLRGHSDNLTRTVAKFNLDPNESFDDEGLGQFRAAPRTRAARPAPIPKRTKATPGGPAITPPLQPEPSDESAVVSRVDTALVHVSGDHSSLPPAGGTGFREY